MPQGIPQLWMKESLESLFAGFREVSRNRVLLRSVAELFFLVHLTQPTKLRDPVFISAFAIHFPWDFQEVPWNLPNDPKTADTTSLLFGVPRAPRSLGGFGGFSDFRWENRKSQSMFDDTGGDNFNGISMVFGQYKIIQGQSGIG